MGHSHGGMVALDHVLAGRFGAPPDRLVLAAPWLALAMQVPVWKRVAGRMLGRVWPTLSMRNEIKAQDVSRNPLVVANFDLDPLVHHVATARWFVEALATEARVRGAAATLRVPTLLLVAGEDRVVSSPAARAFAAAAGPIVQVREYADLYHELFLEPEHRDVVAEIARWLTNPLAAGAEDRPANADRAIIKDQP